jgi:hypothetical protein
MNSVNIPLGILRRVSEFLAELPEDQLAALAEGRARLAYVPEGALEPAPRKRAASGARAPKQPAPPSDAVVAKVEQLRSLDSREAVDKEINSLQKPELVELAKALSVSQAGRLGKDGLRAAIIEATVGRRLDSLAIRGFVGDRP